MSRLGLICPARVTRCVNFAYKCRVFVQTRVHKLLEGLGEVTVEGRGCVLRDMKENSHGMHVGVGWLSLS